MNETTKAIALLTAATATGAGAAVNGIRGVKTFQAIGTTSAGAGSATIVIQGTVDQSNWNTIGTITLTLGTSATSDSFTSDDRFLAVRANVTAISGTGAAVSASMAH